MPNEELKGLFDELKSNLKDMHEEGSKEFNTKLEELDTRFKTIEEQMKAAPSGVPGLSDEKDEFSFAKLINAAIMQKDGKVDPWKDAGFERSACEAWMQTKDAIAQDGSQGGYLIPPEYSSEVVGLTLANMPILNMGVRKLTGLKGDLPIPRITGRNTGYWVGETEAPTESSGSFGEFTLRPKKVGAWTKISRRLVRQTSGAADAIIKQNLSEGMALKLNEGLLSGTGSDAQPLGILNTSGMTTTAAKYTNGDRFTVDYAAAMNQALDVANEISDAGQYGYIMRPEVLGGLKRQNVLQFSGQTVGTGQPLDMQNILMTKEKLAAVIGYPLESTTQLSNSLTKGTSSTCSNVIYGNWQQFYVGFWMGFELRVSAEASDTLGSSSFLKDQFMVLALQEVDSNVGRATAFTTIADAETLEANWSF